jgi:hypothetical protein
MKKSKTKDQEQNWKPRRLSLNRETIRVLNEQVLLKLAKGGDVTSINSSADCCRTTSSTRGGG